jgi:hypothetical protein
VRVPKCCVPSLVMYAAYVYVCHVCVPCMCSVYVCECRNECGLHVYVMNVMHVRVGTSIYTCSPVRICLHVMYVCVGKCNV